jgi:hypothetical protein
VTVAGSEPLVARRGIQLPESFHRELRNKETQATAAAGLLVMIMLGALVSAAIFVGRKKPAIVTDAIVSGRAKWYWIFGLAGVLLADFVNGYPNALYGYDTASPWTNHVTTTLILGLVGPPFGALLFTGLWNVMEMLRKRAGIVAWPDARDGFSAQDAIVAGVGLGALIRLTAFTAGLIGGDSLPAVPSGGALTQIVPMLDATLRIPVAVVSTLAVPAIPVLTVLAVTPSVRKRWMIVAGAFALSVAFIAPVAGSIQQVEITPLGSLVSLLRAAAIVAALIHWGRRSALTWIVAALTMLAIGSTHAVMGAATTGERIGHSLTVLVTLGLLSALIRRATRLPERPMIQV